MTLKYKQMLLGLEGMERPGVRRTGAGRKAIDLAGRRFERLVVIEKAGLGPGGHITWHVVCDCGSHGIVSGDKLRLQRTRSCGCLSREVSRRRMVTLNAARRSP